MLQLQSDLAQFKALNSQRASIIPPDSLRAPRAHEPQRVAKDEIVIVPKLTKIECDMVGLKLTFDQVLKRYEAENINPWPILESHERQLEARQEVSGLLHPSQIVWRGELRPEQIRGAKAVIALGGDNHLQWVARWMVDGYMIGVNSDPARSEGALTRFQAADLPQLLERLAAGEFLIADWTRLEGEIDGKPIDLALGEYFIGETERAFMSRHVIKVAGLSEEQKCSGLLVTTGAGSTGWYNSASRYLHAGGDPFSRTERLARFLVTEPYQGKLASSELLEGSFDAGEELVIHSLNDSRGIVTADSNSRYTFGRGSVARIRISEDALKVVSS
ncbi:MAG: hypothetical protein DCC75_00845 [Proteobacteria bacterium]|nr:MAG: hypothetical protein DCC75_00845 [Pseudomonadota bacterium]